MGQRANLLWGGVAEVTRGHVGVVTRLPFHPHRCHTHRRSLGPRFPTLLFRVSAHSPTRPQKRQ
eukprot:1724016-Rhodomonas_salina.1